jgi:hypothetical protein
MGGQNRFTVGQRKLDEAVDEVPSEVGMLVLVPEPVRSPVGEQFANRRRLPRRRIVVEIRRPGRSRLLRVAGQGTTGAPKHRVRGERALPLQLDVKLMREWGVLEVALATRPVDDRTASVV